MAIPLPTYNDFGGVRSEQGRDFFVRRSITSKQRSAQSAAELWKAVGETAVEFNCGDRSGLLTNAMFKRWFDTNTQ